MCLAKVYVDARDGDALRLLMENVTRVLVDGEKIRVTSLLGDSEEVEGTIESIDFVEGRLLLTRSGA